MCIVAHFDAGHNAACPHSRGIARWLAMPLPRGEPTKRGSQRAPRQTTTPLLPSCRARHRARGRSHQQRGANMAVTLRHTHELLTGWLCLIDHRVMCTEVRGARRRIGGALCATGRNPCGHTMVRFLSPHARLDVLRVRPVTWLDNHASMGRFSSPPVLLDCCCAAPDNDNRFPPDCKECGCIHVTCHTASMLHLIT